MSYRKLLHKKNLMMLLETSGSCNITSASCCLLLKLCNTVCASTCASSSLFFESSGQESDVQHASPQWKCTLILTAVKGIFRRLDWTDTYSSVEGQLSSTFIQYTFGWPIFSSHWIIISPSEIKCKWSHQVSHVMSNPKFLLCQVWFLKITFTHLQWEVRNV